MKNRSGFTLLELIITMGIIAIVSGIAIPNYISWQNKTRFNRAMGTLAGDLALAKQYAIRNNAPVVANFSSDSYSVFIDADNDTVKDATETQVQNRTLPGGVKITQAVTFKFLGTGRCNSDNTGKVVVDSGSREGFIEVNRLGRIQSSLTSSGA